VGVAVGDGAFLVVDGGEHDAAGRLHGARVRNIHHFGHPSGNGERSTGLHRDEQPAFADEPLEIGDSLVAETAADVVSGVQAGCDEVWSFGGVFPRTWIASHGKAAQYGAQASGAS